MADVIHLDSFRRKQAASRGFKGWSGRFGEKLDEETRLSDLSDKTLAFLISPGEQNIFVLYDLIMGVKDLGRGSDFFQLDKSAKMVVIDISIHLLDQLRFECMRRLDWLAGSAQQQMTILQLIEQYPHLTKHGRLSVPPLSSTHPTYMKYLELADFEKETFVRKQIPAAIEEFKKRLQG
jgi:hypothetical protein